MSLNLKEVKWTHAKKIWMVDLLFLLLKKIRSFRQEQNIKERIEVYCELIPKWKNKLDTNFDFNYFLFPLTKSKVYFNLSELETDLNLFYITDFQPFGTLKFSQPKSTKQTNLNSEKIKTEMLMIQLTKKLKYFEKEFSRTQNLLANKNFLQKAPPDLVENEKKKLVYFTKQKEKILEQLKNN